MPRIRTIKPEMFRDEKLGPLPVIDRFVFIGLISMADDRGRVLDNAKAIDAFIFPWSDDTSASSVQALHRLGMIRRGLAESSQKVIQIAKWEHQKIDRPNYHGCLPPIVQEIVAEQLSDDSTKDRRSLDEGSSNHTSYQLSVSAIPIPSARKRASAKSVEEPEVDAIIAYYLEQHPHRRPGPKERRIVWAAMKELGYSADDVKAAIAGNARSAFHQERKLHGLTLILRDNEHIDAFRLAAAPEPFYDEAKYGPAVLNGVISDRFDLMTNPDRAAEWSRAQRMRA